MINKSKSFFYIMFAIGISVFSVDRIYKTWRAWQDEKTKQELLVNNRLYMDNLYQGEFETIYYKQKTDRAYLIQAAFGGDGPKHDLKVLEERMIADGYTHAEVIVFNNRAYAKYKDIE